MPTKNVVVTQTWTAITSSPDGTLLITWEEPSDLEIATTSAATAPTVTGHRFNNEESITRGDLGDGYVWARTISGAFQKQLTVIVSS